MIVYACDAGWGRGWAREESECASGEMRLLRRKGSERRLSGGAPFASEGCWEKLEEAMISEEWGILGEICSLGNGGSRLAESRLAVAQEVFQSWIESSGGAPVGLADLD